MPRILAIHGSPRRGGNTSTLLAQAVDGARQEGAQVEEVVLRDLRMSPCLEIYACKKDGLCAIQDDFQGLRQKLLDCQGLMLASPIFFYTVGAHVKIMMDRCQSLWVKKYWIDRTPFGRGPLARKGLFISVGATKGARLFESPLLTVKYFMDILDMELWRSLLYRGLDLADEAREHPEYLEEARRVGAELARALSTT